MEKVAIKYNEKTSKQIRFAVKTIRKSVVRLNYRLVIGWFYTVLANHNQENQKNAFAWKTRISLVNLNHKVNKIAQENEKEDPKIPKHGCMANGLAVFLPGFTFILVVCSLRC